MMERFIIHWHDGDGCTWSAEFNQPIYYESQEALYVHLEEDIKTMLDGNEPKHGVMDRLSERGFYERANVTQTNQNYDYKSKNGKFWFIFMPDIFTLDEWFDKKYNNLV
jgi:hypothetical protein